MPNKIDLTGQRFGMLTVLRRAATRGRETRWRCVCECGSGVVVQTNNLRSGQSTCGCRGRRWKHGMSRSPEYRSWAAMIQRCTNPNHKHWRRYGGRGITICARWRERFEDFFADMSKKPDGTTLDRIDNNGNYEPGNCRWATQSEQCLNRGGYRHSAETRTRITAALKAAHRQRPRVMHRDAAGRLIKH